MWYWTLWYLRLSIGLWNWRLIDWVSQRHVWLEVAPWVLPVFGGLLISSQLHSKYVVFWFFLGVIIICLGAFPLGMKVWHQGRIERKVHEVAAQKLSSHLLAAELLEEIPLSSSKSLREKESIRDAAMRKVVKDLTYKIYSNVPNVRVTFFAHGVLGGKSAYHPQISLGRPDPPYEHFENSENYNAMKEIFQTEKESHSRSGVVERSYSAYVSAFAARGGREYGLLSLDTSEKSYLFTNDDEENLLLLARVLAIFYAVVELEAEKESSDIRFSKSLNLASSVKSKISRIINRTGEKNL